MGDTDYSVSRQTNDNEYFQHFSTQDKTFGLKNKKGTKNQKYVAQVTQQVKMGGGKSAKELAKQEEEKAKKKELAGQFTFPLAF